MSIEVYLSAEVWPIVETFEVLWVKVIVVNLLWVTIKITY